jgi:predicted dehydrogenase
VVSMERPVVGLPLLIDVVGTKWSVRLESAYEYSVGMQQITCIGGRTKTQRNPVHDQFAPQLRYFSHCILRDREPEPSGQEGMIDVTILEALHPSARTGQAVEVEVSSKRSRPPCKQVRSCSRVPPRARITSPTR